MEQGYGLTMENPVLCGGGAIGERDYFLRLRCSAGKPVKFVRVCSCPSFEIGHPRVPEVSLRPGSNAPPFAEELCKTTVMIDVFKLVTADDKSMEVYVDMYHEGPEKPLDLPGWSIISPLALLGELLETFATQPIPDYQGFLNAVFDERFFSFEDSRHLEAVAHTLDELEATLKSIPPGKALPQDDMSRFLKWKLLFALLERLDPDRIQRIDQMRAGNRFDQSPLPSPATKPCSSNGITKSGTDIVDTLEKSGYALMDWPHLSSLGVQVFRRGERSAVVIPPPASLQPQAPSQQEFEAYLNNLIKNMESLHKSFPMGDIYFQGGRGGSFKIPDWFIDWCKQHGLRIHVVPPTGGTVQIGLIEEQLFDADVSQKIRNDYGLAGTYRTPHDFADALLKAIGQTPLNDPLAPSYSNSDIFEAAVRALGSNARKWSTFLAKEPALRQVLHGYDPGMVVSSGVSPASLMPFLPGQTAPNDSYAIIAWAHLLNATPDYYQTVIVPVAKEFQRLVPSLPISHILLCLVGFFGTDPGRYGGSGSIPAVLPPSLSKVKWCGQMGYTTAKGRQVSRNIIYRKWKFPGMGYALGSELMRNLGWNGFKVDRHIKRLFSMWMPIADPNIRTQANHLAATFGGSASTDMKENFYYSYLGMAVSPYNVWYSHVDNLIWALGAYVERKGSESPTPYLR